MHRRTFFSINVAIFILTWTQFTVMGIPKTRFQLCKDRGFETACQTSYEDFPCEFLKCGRRDDCFRLELYKVFLPTGVPDRTKCGPSKVCRKKQCVPIDGPMPLYFGNDTFSLCVPKRYLGIRPIPTRHEQCKDYGLDVACEQTHPQHTGCARLRCGYKTTHGSFMMPKKHFHRSAFIPAAGTRCGDNKACYKRRCIPLSQFPTPERIQYTGEEIFHECT